MLEIGPVLWTGKRGKTGKWCGEISVPYFEGSEILRSLSEEVGICIDCFFVLDSGFINLKE